MRATIYNASAGSGKTYTLAYKYVHDVVKCPELYRKILAVTFTNKATEEMKRRILSEIHSLAAGDKSNYLERLTREVGMSEEQVRAQAKIVRTSILHDYSRFTILTIDRFFQRIIRAFIQELGIDLNYNIELDPAALLSQSADRIIEEIELNEDLKEWISGFIEERIEDGRGWDIHEGILSLGGEIFKESNRTSIDSPISKSELKEIVERFGARSRSGREQLVQWANEAIELMRADGKSFEDFSGKSTSFTKYFGLVASGALKEPTPTARKKADDATLWGKGVEATAAKMQPLLQKIIESYDQNIKMWNTATLLRENYRSFALLADLHNMVKQVSNDQNMMLLSETKMILSEFIEHNDAPFIYEKVGNHFERYMIDEFQDTSLKEWNNFLPLLANSMAQSEEDESRVLIVGDIKQSIYRWRGGDWSILHSQARRDLGEDQTEVINLKENYRSLPEVVKFNNAVIAEVVKADNDELNSRLASNEELSEGCRLELTDMLKRAYTQHEQIPRKTGESEGYVELTIHDNDKEPEVVERIKELIDLGFRPCEILILVRSNSEGVRIASELLSFKSTCPDPRYDFDVMTQEALVVGLAPVSQFVIAALMLSTNQKDTIQRAIYNRFLNKVTLDEPLDESEIELLRSIRLLSCEEAFENIVMHYKLDRNKSSVAYLQAIHEAICSFCSSKSGDIAQFLKWWEEHGSRRSISVEQSEKSIEITTIHKAKGLEKAAVIIPYCTWQLEPKSSGGGKIDPKRPQMSNAVWAEATGELESLGAFPVKYKSAMGESLFSEQYYREAVYSHIDNINMLYVALTRASQALHIFIRRGRAGVGKAIEQVVKFGDEVVSIGDTEGYAVSGEKQISLCFGKKGRALPRKQSGGNKIYTMDSYPTAQADLRLRLPSQRYFEQGDDEQGDEGGISLTPRHEGILMHKAFAEATTATQIAERLNSMLLNAIIDEAQHHSLSAKIEQALQKDPIKEWFEGDWDQVLNERDIILPRSSSFKRPDRVMIKGQRAVVVDYKFGFLENKQHQKQVGEYMALLKEMGYEDVSGYLWYIKSGTIVAI